MWVQEKRKAATEARIMAGKTGRGISDEEQMNVIKQISRVEGALQLIPAEVISRRAVECGSYSRALFHWEQYIRQQQQVKGHVKQWFSEKDNMLQHLQSIYAQIDEPDSIEGISAHLRVLNPEQQIIEDRKAGRLTAAQSWYEIALAEKPNDTETQLNLLACLKESGQYGKMDCVRSRMLADIKCRLDSQLRRPIQRFQYFIKQYPALCSRGSMVSGQMGTARARSWLVTGTRKVHLA
jgi:serine/threonine-protein kinase ATR